MKRFNFLPVVIAGLLMVVAVGCTTSRDIYEDDYRTSRQADRILVDDPYYGTIVMERDPFTGRYYQVGTLGMSPYGSRYGTYGRNVRNYPRYNPRRQPVYQRDNNNNQQRDPEQRERSRQEARTKVLGKGN